MIAGEITHTNGDFTGISPPIWYFLFFESFSSLFRHRALTSTVRGNDETEARSEFHTPPKIILSSPPSPSPVLSPSIAMPYNTRRKSLSLPSLGIHVPSSSRRSKASNPASATPSSASTTNNSSSSTSSHLLPPNKKLKRSDPNGSSRSSSRKSPHDSPGSNDENGNDTDGASMGNLKLRRSYGDYTTPPPSPGSKTDCDNRERCGAVAPPGDHRLNEHKDIPHLNPVNRSFSTSQNIDRSAINDDIVVAVIEQLEVTGNRPHLIKELATALACKNETIAKYVSFSICPIYIQLLLLCLTMPLVTHDKYYMRLLLTDLLVLRTLRPCYPHV